jgi:hypothetical protein
MWPGDFFDVYERLCRGGGLFIHFVYTVVCGVVYWWLRFFGVLGFCVIFEGLRGQMLSDLAWLVVLCQ